VSKCELEVSMFASVSVILSYILLCRYCWNVATFNWKVHDGKIEIISLLS